LNRPELPSGLAELRDVLDSLGFAVVSEQSGGMGGYELVLSGRLPGRSGEVLTYVHINADRMFWSVGIKFGAMRRWTAANVWKSYLDEVPIERKEVDWHARFIADRLGDMVAAFEADPGIEADLRERGEKYMRRHLGLE
jgi:hypothetical protein